MGGCKKAGRHAGREQGREIERHGEQVEERQIHVGRADRNETGGKQRKENTLNTLTHATSLRLAYDMTWDPSHAHNFFQLKN